MPMITLKKHGRTKLISKKTYSLLGGNLDGWVVARKADTAPVPSSVEAQVNTENKPLTRDEMIGYLREKGVKVHWNLSDDKLKQRYESEIEIN